VAWLEAAVAKRYRVTLTAEEREALGGMISRGKADARKLAHARVLLQADASEGGPDWTDEVAPFWWTVQGVADCRSVCISCS
jgi:hypothetical protein